MKRDLVDELYKTAYKRYREKYPNKNFVSIPNFLDSLITLSQKWRTAEAFQSQLNANR